MHDIIEHYGKVIVALAGVLAAVLLTVAVVKIVNTKTTTAVDNISYEQQIQDAIGATTAGIGKRTGIKRIHPAESCRTVSGNRRPDTE